MVLRILLLSALIVAPACRGFEEREPSPSEESLPDEVLSEEPPVPEGGAQDPPVETWKPVSQVLGDSVEGRPIGFWELGHGREVVAVIATIHGDEWAGTPLCATLRDHLIENPRYLTGRKVLIVPVANPDGYHATTRHNVNGVDLNRNFPAENFKASKRHGSGALSEPESRALMKLLENFDPVRVVSIHQPVACIDYDGDGLALANAMAEVCDLPVRKLGSRPGSMGSYVGLTRDRPIITFELPRGVEELGAQELWKRYGAALLAFIEGNASP